MAILSKYIRPDVLSAVAHTKIEPRQLVEGTLAGAHKSPFHGFAVEFASHREYVPGDDLRHLDWKVYYRHDRHVIKQYEMETNFVCNLMLDISSSMRYGEGDQQKMVFAAQMAVILAYLVVEQSDRVSLTTFDDKIRQHLTPSNALGQIIKMSELLDDTEAKEKTGLGSALGDLAARIGRREIVIILSDFFGDLDELNDALQRLRYDRHEVVLMQVLHNDEIDFQLPGMVRFEGLEDDDQMLTRPEDIREGYLEAFRAFNKRLEDIAESNHCEHVVCDTSRNMAELFADYLQKRLLSHRRW